MKIVQNNTVPIRLAVTCCLHGDEIFGLKVWQDLQRNIQNYPGLLAILANEEAIEAQRRFIDNDLNRSFPGYSEGSHEQRLAAKILNEVKDAPLLIDIHTTTSELKMAPIITGLDAGVRQIINQTDSAAVWSMGPSPFSLIGQFRSGVSLEFGEKYTAEPAAMEEMMRIISRVLEGKGRYSQQRQVFLSTGVIDMNVKLPPTSKNFEHIEGIGYPFLLWEKSYGHQGFVARNYRTEAI